MHQSPHRNPRTHRVTTGTLLALLTLWASACTHHHQATRVPSSLRGDLVTLHGHDGQSMPARVTRAGNLESLHGRRVDITSVHTVSSTSRSLGLFEGALFGGGIGALAGALLASEANSNQGDCEKGCDDVPVVVGVVLVGGVGLLVGGFIGLVRGATNVYTLEPKPGLPSVSVVPARGGARAALTWDF